MNWLAHIYLSDEDNESKIGGLLGDFLCNDWTSKYSEAIKQGIRRHLDVDKFTDTHPVFKNSCSRISVENSYLAPVLIDIFYDHFLAKNWDDYSNVSLEDFVSSFYKVLLEHKEILPDKLQNIIFFMIKENWLCSYKNIEGIKNVLYRLSRRINRQNRIVESIIELQKNYSDLESDFQRFFPEIVHAYCPDRK
ncbi:MAG: acyl carrier protein phosphodiesterase [Spirochaetales bacterium]|nr:acyl carrier protein phosphodiesterase [Spirochaetales bacterium]